MLRVGIQSLIGWRYTPFKFYRTNNSRQANKAKEMMPNGIIMI